MPILNKIVILLCLISRINAQAYPKRIPIAALYRNVEEKELKNAFMEAVQYHNNATTFFEVDKTDTVMKSDVHDTWEVMQMICQVAQKGFFYLMGAGDYRVHNAYASLCKELNAPFINWALPPTNDLNQFEVSMMPMLTNIVGDIVISKGWQKVTYILDNPQGYTNLERLSEHLRRKKKTNFVANVKLFPETSDEESLRKFFHDFHDSRDTVDRHVILDIKAGEKLSLTLKTLKEVAKKSFRYHYLITALDITEEDMASFPLESINITAFQLVDKNTDEFRKMQNWRLLNKKNPLDAKETISVDAALAYDSVFVAITAVYNVLQLHSGLFNHTFKRGELWSNGHKGFYCFPSDDRQTPNRPFKPLENGLLLASYLRQVVTNGLTGRIEFNKEGFRKKFQIKVFDTFYSMTAGQSAAMNYIWEEGVGVVNNSQKVTRLWSKKSAGIDDKDKPLRITTVFANPFIMKVKDYHGKTGNDRYEGYCVDLMEKIAANLSRKFEIQLVKDNGYGNVRENGRWDGMIGELLNDEADLAVAPLTINRQRERVVDFSKPFMTTGISIMLLKPEKQEFSVFSFMQPLSEKVWMYIIFAYIGVSLIIFLVARFSPYEWRIEERANGNLVVSNDFSLYNCLWFTLAAFMQQGTDIVPRSVSGRIASSAWWFFTMIIVSSYTANLAASFTLEKMKITINSAEDLVGQSKVKYGIQRNGSTATFFKESTFPTYRDMWNYMNSQTDVFVDNYDHGIDKVRASKGHYAFLLEATANEYASNRKPCNTMKVGDFLNSLGYGVATKFGSPLRSPVNLVILDLLEKGELKIIEDRWWYEKGECEKGADSQSVSLTLSKVAGIFYILIGGMVMAMIVSLSEFLYRARIEARKNNRMTSLSIPYRDDKEKDMETEKINDFVWKS